MEKRRNPKRIAKIVGLVLLILGLLVSLTVLLFTPRTIIKDWREIELSSMQVILTVDTRDINITESMDLERLAQCLPLLQARRFPEFRYSFLGSDREYHLSLWCGDTHYDIYLRTSRDNSYVRTIGSPNGWYYEILNDESFIVLLELLDSGPDLPV